jgi:hypothetical protein
MSNIFASMKSQSWSVMLRFRKKPDQAAAVLWSMDYDYQSVQYKTIFNSLQEGKRRISFDSLSEVRVSHFSSHFMSQNSTKLQTNGF